MSNSELPTELLEFSMADLEDVWQKTKIDLQRIVKEITQEKIPSVIDLQIYRFVILAKVRPLRKIVLTTKNINSDVHILYSWPSTARQFKEENIIYLKSFPPEDYATFNLAFLTFDNVRPKIDLTIAWGEGESNLPDETREFTDDFTIWDIPNEFHVEQGHVSFLAFPQLNTRLKALLT